MTRGPATAECVPERRDRSRADAWSALLDRAAAGDPRACAAFYDESSGLLFSLIMHILQDREASEAALEDVYTDVWPRARRGEHRHGNAVSWCLALARDAALARLVPEADTRPAVQLPPLPTTSAVVDPSSHERLRVNRALAGLTPRQQALLRLTQFGGLTVDQAADRLSLPRTVVVREIHAALQALRDGLA